MAKSSETIPVIETLTPLAIGPISLKDEKVLIDSTVMVKMAETELFNYGNTSTFYTRVQDKNIELSIAIPSVNQTIPRIKKTR